MIRLRNDFEWNNSQMNNKCRLEDRPHDWREEDHFNDNAPWSRSHICDWCDHCETFKCEVED